MGRSYIVEKQAACRSDQKRNTALVG